MSNKIIEVQNIKVNITNIDDNDYISISDFGKYKEGKSKADDIIRNWLRNRITLEFLGTWESIYNPNFNSVEFDGFRKSAGLHTFTLSVTEWCDKTNAIGIYSKRGKYGGTYAHKDIAFEFASAISPVFKLYLTVFNTTAKKWRELNSDLAKTSNVRDYATINELTVLSNLESHNAELIKEGKSKEERFEILSEIAKYQLNILNNAEKIKLLGNGNKEE